MNKCVVLSGGVFYKSDLNEIKDSFIICADSGYKHALKYNIKPNLLVGDFDSIEEIPDNIEIKKLNPIKDETDTFEAIEEGILRGFKEFILLGALGKREEHAIANISLLIYLKNRGFAGKIVQNGKTFIVLKDESIRLDKRKNGYFSLFSLSATCDGVSIKNAKYELENAALTQDFPLGIDNEFINLSPEISIKNGTILLIYW